MLSIKILLPCRAHTHRRQESSARLLIGLIKWPGGISRRRPPAASPGGVPRRRPPAASPCCVSHPAASLCCVSLLRPSAASPWLQPQNSIRRSSEGSTTFRPLRSDDDNTTTATHWWVTSNDVADEHLSNMECSQIWRLSLLQPAKQYSTKQRPFGRR